jgi:predicted enzyme related to lactoylglutathione lyase
MATRRPSPTQTLVVFAKNKKRLSAFYQQTLALEVLESHTSHDLLGGHGIEIVVHAIPRKYAADILISKPPQIREDTPFKPVFVVNSLTSVRTAAEAAGGGLKAIEQAWQIRGDTVLDGHDPEGNVVQFKQRGK